MARFVGERWHWYAKPEKATEQKNAPELPIGRFGKSKSLGGNRVILTVRQFTRGDVI